MVNSKAFNQKVAALFDSRGERYSLAWKPVAKQRLSELEISLVQQAVVTAGQSLKRKKLRTLDVGIGTGRISEAVLANDVEHWGIDISQAMVSYCKKKFINNQKLMRLKVHDIVDPLPASWGKFDVVTAVRVLSYTPLWQKAIRNIYQAMSPGGVLLFTFPNKYSTMMVSKWFMGERYNGFEVSFRGLKKVLQSIGFSGWDVGGLNRLLDSFYDWCDNERSTKILFTVERGLGIIFGPTFLTREFYVTCKK